MADIQIAVEISGVDEAEVEQRLEAIAAFIGQRLDKTTFRRLAGQPRVELVAPMGEPSLT